MEINLTVKSVLVINMSRYSEHIIPEDTRLYPYLLVCYYKAKFREKL